MAKVAGHTCSISGFTVANSLEKLTLLMCKSQCCCLSREVSMLMCRSWCGCLVVSM